MGGPRGGRGWAPGLRGGPAPARGADREGGGRDERLVSRRARAEQVLRSTMGADEEFAVSAGLQVIFFTGVLADMGRFAEARQTPARLLQKARARGLPRQEGQARLSLARARLLEGDLAAAE